MKVNKFLVITILGIILALSTTFVTLHENTGLSAQTEQNPQVVHSNDYTAIIDATYQASLAAPSQTLKQMGTIITSKRSD